MNGNNPNINLDVVLRQNDTEKVAIYNTIDGKGHCPFCPENLATYHKRPIIVDGTYWILTDNQWPYPKIKHQLLAIHKKHIEHISEMTPEAGAELIKLFAEEAKKRNIKGGGVAIRFGSNPELGNYGNTVLHIHAHLIEPDLSALAPNEAWKFKFGQPKDYKKVS
jgi:diadenosine tetraphosphate (Ap4A) HIT family hydrolase